jgi:hypothetical protein
MYVVVLFVFFFLKKIIYIYIYIYIFGEKNKLKKYYSWPCGIWNK